MIVAVRIDRIVAAQWTISSAQRVGTPFGAIPACRPHATSASPASDRRPRTNGRGAARRFAEIAQGAGAEDLRQLDQIIRPAPQQPRLANRRKWRD